MQPDYIARIDELKDDMIQDLCALVRCASVQGEPAEGAPFGRAVDEALQTMLALGRREGLRDANLDGMCGMLDAGPEDAEALFGILCHLDVVPEGEGWTKKPFDPEITEDRIYGRGTLDDKGPTIAVFYALKALLDCGYRPDRRIRMILGLNEETGEESIHYYREHAEMPDFSIVPDADFPVVHGEKGILVCDLVRPFGKVRRDGYRLVKIEGGHAANMVPDRAEAVVDAGDATEAFLEQVQAYMDKTGHTFAVEKEGSLVTITASGVSAHGAMPWKGQNAISLLIPLLESIEFHSVEVNEILDFYEEHIGFDLHGERLDIHCHDERSGELVVNVGMLRMDEEAFRLTLNLRLPVSYDDAFIFENMAALLSRYSLKVEKGMYQPPIYFDAADPRIEKLVNIYRKHTGDYESKPLVIGGGTYARQFTNAVGFGAMFPGDPDTMHAKDEFVLIERLVQTAKIYAETLYEFAFEKKEEGAV